MKAFAALLDGLVFAPQRTVKLRLMQRYFRETPDPDRGWGLAALGGTLDFVHAKPALVRALVTERVDPELFALSYDFVGDLAETTALIWPAAESESPLHPPPSLGHVAHTLTHATKAEVPDLLRGWLDTLDASGRYALLKLITGDLRVGVSARLAKHALAGIGPTPAKVADIEEIWHGVAPPYQDLFAWLEGRGGLPKVDDSLGFRPLMLSTPVDEAELADLDASHFVAEWKWDGIRVQVVARNGEGRVYSRTGDDITGAFPDIANTLRVAPGRPGATGYDTVVDGELLVVRGGIAAPFNDLQQRLGRKSASAALLDRHPAAVRLYDILREDDEDLRPLPFTVRRERLERWFRRMTPERMDLSPTVPFARWEDLAALRTNARADGIEGLMLKRKDSPYVAGRPKGLWYKWKRDPLTADCVLMYAQRGHGKRSSYYSDFTFGCWHTNGQASAEITDGATADKASEAATDERTLVPVGKAYFGFTDQELIALDKWVRTHTTERFGPVRAVSPDLVLEIAFDAVQPSTRHKSGIAMRFPRVHRIRWDKPAREADTVAGLRRLIPGDSPTKPTPPREAVRPLR